jgi:hypothetical protein
MRKLIIALALLATISAPAFAGRLSEASATANHDANVSANANMSGSAGAPAGATVGIR